MCIIWINRFLNNSLQFAVHLWRSWSRLQQNWNALNDPLPYIVQASGISIIAAGWQINVGCLILKHGDFAADLQGRIWNGEGALWAHQHCCIPSRWTRLCDRYCLILWISWHLAEGRQVVRVGQKPLQFESPSEIWLSRRSQTPKSEIIQAQRMGRVQEFKDLLGLLQEERMGTFAYITLTLITMPLASSRGHGEHLVRPTLRHLKRRGDLISAFAWCKLALDQHILLMCPLLSRYSSIRVRGLWGKLPQCMKEECFSEQFDWSCLNGR